jgi:hypothetical protein
MRLHGRSVTPPQPDVVSVECKITCRRKRAVAAAENRDTHSVVPRAMIYVLVMAGLVPAIHVFFAVLL